MCFRYSSSVGVLQSRSAEWADFLLGDAQTLGISTEYINPATVRESMYAFYARDQWQVSRKFTLSYGIRYELYPLATRDHYGANIYNPNTGVVCLGGLGGAPKDCGVDVGDGNWGPRLGLAYRFNDKTVIRAGYGISVDPNSYRVMRDAYPATIAESISGATSFQAAGTLATEFPPSSDRTCPAMCRSCCRRRSQRQLIRCTISVVTLSHST